MLERPAAHGQDRQGEVELAALELLGQVVGVALEDGEGDVGVVLVEAREHPRQQRGAEARGRAHGHVAAAQVLHLGDGAHHVVDGSEGAARDRQQRLAGVGEGDGAVGPVEQFDVEDLLEAPDLGAERGLGDPEVFGRRGELSRLGHRDEAAQLVEGRTIVGQHREILSNFSDYPPIIE